MSRNFPSFIDAFVDSTKTLGGSDKFILWSAIAGISAALERKTWVNYNGQRVIYPNQFIMLVAESGIARKSTSAGKLAEIVFEVDGIKTMSSQLTGASLIEEMKETGEEKIFEFGGIKYKNSSLFAYSSEAANTLGESTNVNSIQKLLTEFYDCGDPNFWTQKKGWLKSTVGGGKVAVFNPCLNMLACSTPNWLNSSIGKTGIEGGFASRIIFVTDSTMAASVGWLEDDNDNLSKISENTRLKLVQDLTAINKIQGKYRQANGCHTLYNDIERIVRKKLPDSGIMAPYYSRKMNHILKLAQVLAADMSDDLIMFPEHIQKAKELLEAIEPEMYSAFATKGENRNLTSLTLVWQVMRTKRQWYKDRLLNLVFRHATLNQLDDHLYTLTQMKRVKYQPETNTYDVLDNSPLGHSR